jgi:hypothetical protein
MSPIDYTDPEGVWNIYKDAHNNHTVYIENNSSGIKAKAFIGDNGQLQIRYMNMWSPYIGVDISIPTYIRDSAMCMLQYMKTLNS